MNADQRRQARDAARALDADTERRSAGPAKRWVRIPAVVFDSVRRCVWLWTAVQNCFMTLYRHYSVPTDALALRWQKGAAGERTSLVYLGPE